MKRKLLSLTVMAVSLVLCTSLSWGVSPVSVSAAETSENDNVVEDIYNNKTELLPATRVTIFNSKDDKYCMNNAESPLNAPCQTTVGTPFKYLFDLGKCGSANYTCNGGVIYNRDNDNKGDLLINEVTYGGDWYAEAAKVYLTGVVIKDKDNNLKSYPLADDNHGYYVGIAWNRIGERYINDEDCVRIAKKYFNGNRDLKPNYFYSKGDALWSGINFPDEVVSATGVTLVDATDEVHDIISKDNLQLKYGYRKIYKDLYGSEPGGYDVESIYGFTKEK